MSFLNFLGSSSHKDNSSTYRNKTFISSPTNITPELAQELLKFVNPVTLASTDLQGRTIQLWHHKSELVASVIKEDKISLIPGDCVFNSLQPSERGSDLLKRLQTGNLKKWQFAYVRGKISLWPHLIAAGRDGQSDWNPPVFPQRPDKLSHIFSKREKEGHFTQDTPQNREYISRAIISPHNIVARDPHGKQLYMQTQHDGSQSWAWVQNGIIRSGGRNERPKTWRQMGAKTIDFYTSSKFTKQSGRTPATEQFRQVLQQTKLTESYKSSNPNSTIGPKGGSNGQIGGVGNKTGIIEGLMSEPTAIFDTEHFFMLPSSSDAIAFSPKQLQQVLRELAIGIYVHDTTPFFSLHFNQDAMMFPVIHPAYEKTLVGRVIGMLDYVMKGYLNGGIFDEALVDQWKDQMTSLGPNSLDRLLLFKGIYHTHPGIKDKNYRPLKELIHEASLAGSRAEGEIFSDFSNFSNSFRIIAKQNQFKYAENVFEIDPDFDVEYTIVPDPKYERALKAFIEQHGRQPLAYQALIQGCDKMCKQIHDHMVEFPLSKSYFKMLGVINFFSSYFMTLKAQGMVPNLEPLTISPEDQQGCPAVFPHLPVAQDRGVRLVTPDLIKAFKHFHDLPSEETGGVSNRGILEKYLTSKPNPVDTYMGRLGRENEVFSSLPSVRAEFQESKRTLISRLEKSLFETMLPGILEQDIPPLKSEEALRLKMNDGVEKLLNQIALYYDEFVKDKLDPSREFFRLLAPIGTGMRWVGDLRARFNTQGQGDNRAYLLELNKSYAHQFAHSTIQACINDNPLWYQSVPRINRDRTEFGGKSIFLTQLHSRLPEEQRGKRAAFGGCGMNLQPQKLAFSKEIEEFIDEQWPVFYDKPSTAVRDRFVFRMEISPSFSTEDDYGYMESLIHVKRLPQDQEDLKQVELHDLTEAILENDHVKYNQLIGPSTFASLPIDNDGHTLMHVSAQQPDTRYTVSLMNKGVSVTIPDVHGFLPLHYAAMVGEVNQIEALLENDPTTLNAKSAFGMTPLFIAIQHHQIEAVETLLAFEVIDLDTRLAGDYTPLLSALHEGNKEIIQAMLPPINRNQELACQKILTTRYDVEAIREIKRNLPAITFTQATVCTEEKITPLMLACELADIEIVKAVLQRFGGELDPYEGPNYTRYSPINFTDKKGNVALDIAIRNKDLEIIKLLIKDTGPTERLFETIAKHGTIEMAPIIVEHFYHYLSIWKPLFMECIKEGNSTLALALYSGLNDPAREAPPRPLNLTNHGFQYGPEWPQNRPSNDHKGDNDLLKAALEYNSIEFANELMASGNRLADSIASSSEERDKENLEALFLCSKALLQTANGRATLSSMIQESNILHDKIFLKALEEKNRSFLYTFLDLIGIPQQPRGGVLGALHLKSSDTVWTLPRSLKETSQTRGRFAGWTLPHFLVYMDEPYLLFDNFSHEEIFQLRLGGQNGKTLAYIAAEEGNLLAFEKITDLMEENEIPFENQYQGRHLLYGAFESFQEDVIDRALCYFQNTINIPLDSTNIRAVHLAAGKNLVPFLQQMGEYRADFTALDDRGHSPLYYAIGCGGSEAVDFLLKRRCSVAPQDMKKAQETNGPKSEEILQKLLKAGGVLPPKEEVPNIEDPRGLQAFYRAVETKDIAWLNRNLSTLPLNETLPLIRTKQKKPLPLIFDLIDRSLIESLLTVDQLLPLIQRAQEEHPDLKDFDGYSLSHHFVKLSLPEDFEIPQALADQLNLQAQTSSGMTPLHLAAAISPHTTFDWILRQCRLSDLEVEDNRGNTPLFYAVESENNNAAQKLISKGVNPDHRNHRQMTPAAVAACSNKPLVLKTLLDVCDPEKYFSIGGKKITLLHLLAGKDPDGLFIEVLGKTPFPTSSENRRKQIAHILSQEGTVKGLRFLKHQDKKLLSYPNEHKVYPWDSAAYKGNLDVLLFYKEEHPEIFTEDHGRKANKMLVYAATGGQKKTAEWLIEQGVLAHMHSEMPLQEKQQKYLDILKGAASSNCKETLKLFTDLFMTWGSPYFIPTAAFETLPAAILHESTNSLDHIYNDLEFPKDWELTYNGHRMGTGMQVAANHGSFKSAQWLLGNGSDPQETTPSNPTKVLELAAENPSAHQFRHLLETIETPDFQNQEDHQTLLHLASTNGNLHHVALLINEGCDVNIRDRYGLTALERAIVERRADIARVLMLCGADDSSIRKAKGMLNEIVDTDLEKTLDLYKETVKMFEEFEAVFESNRSFSRGSPLHMAVKLGCNLSTLLLSKTPRLNEQDSRGSTPLHWAVLENNLALVRILINSGANLDIKNHREKTPLDLANEISDRKMVRFLDSLPSRQEEAPLQEVVV